MGNICGNPQSTTNDNDPVKAGKNKVSSNAWENNTKQRKVALIAFRPIKIYGTTEWRVDILVWPVIAHAYVAHLFQML